MSKLWREWGIELCSYRHLFCLVARVFFGVSRLLKAAANAMDGYEGLSSRTYKYNTKNICKLSLENTSSDKFCRRDECFHFESSCQAQVRRQLS